MQNDIINPPGGNIRLLRFPKDGLWIELTSKGIFFGSSPSGAHVIAEEVKSLHSKEFHISSLIDTGKLSWQILLHAAAYTGCTVMTEATGRTSKFTLSGAVMDYAAKQACRSIKSHANPINVSWEEIRY
jgi:hypothetical protein